nr:MBOAT family O-acyltransferase [Dethiosulfovibrio faecalis]
MCLIGYFKYANFIMSNAAWLGGWSWTTRDIFLPLGISFFTFQQIAYLIDCSRGLAKEHAFTHYALFVTFFPQLIAGPIVRYDQIMPQFSRLRTFGLSYRNLAMGVTLLTLGLFKKLVIADTLSPWVAAVFDGSDTVTFFEGWAGALCYTFQIYFDFSGYSDMALGLGRMFNIDLPINFDSPYKATSIIDFWRRWHISLSTFLRDYLYIPLGGSRKGSMRRYANLMTTMLLGGLWHGASWNFVVWGGLHGLFLSINHVFRSVFPRRDGRPSFLSRVLSWGLTFPSVVVAWVFFRATTFSRAWDILGGMFGFNGAVLPPNYMPIAAGRRILEALGVDFYYPFSWGILNPRKELLFIFYCFLAVIVLPNSYEWSKAFFRRKRFRFLWAVVLGGLLGVSVCFLNRISEFLYFQF